MFTKRTKVVIDTNALLLFGQEHIDVFSGIDDLIKEPHEVTLPELVIKELEKLSQKNSRDGRAAKLGLALVTERLRRQSEPFLAKLLVPAKEIPLKTVSSSQQHADDAILEIAEDDKAIVVTLDKGLQRRLLDKKLRVIGIKQQRLAFIG